MRPHEKIFGSLRERIGGFDRLKAKEMIEKIMHLTGDPTETIDSALRYWVTNRMNPLKYPLSSLMERPHPLLSEAMKEALRAVSKERVEEIIKRENYSPNTWMEWRAICFFLVQNTKEGLGEDRKRVWYWMSSGFGNTTDLERIDSITAGIRECSIETDARTLAALERMNDFMEDIQEALDIAKNEHEKEMLARREYFGKK